MGLEPADWNLCPRRTNQTDVPISLVCLFLDLEFSKKYLTASFQVNERDRPKRSRIYLHGSICERIDNV